MDSDRKIESGSADELRIAAYVQGDMDVSARAEFERRIGLEPELALEVEQCRRAIEAVREWMEAEPAGLDRVNDLAIPMLKVKSIRPRSRFSMSRRQAVQRIFFTAAIFGVGYLAGRLGSPDDPELVPSIPGPPNGNFVGASLDAQEVQPEIEPDIEPEGDLDSSLQATNEPEPSNAKAVLVRSTTDETGRLIIDTENRNSGLRIRWFVEPAIEIAQTINQF